MPDALETVIADERAKAQVLRAAGHEKQAEYIERVISRVADAAEDYMRFLAESQAILRSGATERWLRAQFAKWEREGNAKWDETRKHRLYRQVVVPMRANPSASYEAGARAADESRDERKSA